MKIQNLNPEKYNRFFAFGCSFTNYKWPTWADIVGSDIPYYQNWGRPGAGNMYIFNSFIESNIRNSFQEGDLVIIMWSSTLREDRYLNKHWNVAPPDEQERLYGKEWLKKFGGDFRGGLVKDLAFISATRDILNGLNCDWAMTSFQPLTEIDEEKDFNVSRRPIEEQRKLWVDIWEDLKTGKISEYLENKDVVELYKETFKDLEISYESTITHEYVKSRKIDDQHPTPEEALAYINKVWPNNTLSDESKQLTQTTKQEFLRL